MAISKDSHYRQPAFWPEYQAAIKAEVDRQKTNMKTLAEANNLPVTTCYHILKRNTPPNVELLCGVLAGLGKNLAWLEKAAKRKKTKAAA